MSKFVEVQNFLQAKALLEHHYIVFIGGPFTDMSLYACYLLNDAIIYVIYEFPYAAILRNGDWDGFQKIYSIARETDTPMFTIMHDFEG
jgi:hypothetical protein